MNQTDVTLWGAGFQNTTKSKGVVMRCVFIGVLMGCASVAGAQPVFEIIPGLAPSVEAANSDCSIIVGWAGNGWVWDEVHGRRSLPMLTSEYTQADPRGISSDGNYVSIQNVRPNSPRRQQSRFNLSTWTHEPVGFSENGRSVEGFGISPDGGTLPLMRLDQPANQLATWRPGEGQVGSFQMPEGNVCWVNDASSDGRVIIGIATQQLNSRAFRASESLHYLAPLVSNESTRAYSISSDGNIVVGQSGLSPVAWVNDVPFAIPSFPTAYSVSASQINFNASVVGGKVQFNEPGSTRAWIWSETTGSVLLQDYLLSIGLVTPDLLTLDAISDDGLRFVGSINGSQVYRVTLQSPIAGLSIPTPASLCLFASSVALGLRRRSR